MKSVEKRSRVAWPLIAPTTFAVAAFVSASLAAALLAGTTFAQVEEETPVFEYTSEDVLYEEEIREETFLEETTPEETAVEATAASENTATGQSAYSPVEQYYVPPSEGVLADTGGAGLWLVGGIGVALLAVVGLMLCSSGLVRGRAGVSSGGSENRRGGSRHE